MFQILKTLFGSRPRRAATKRPAPRFQVEALEARDVPATALLGGGTLYVIGNDARESITIDIVNNTSVVVRDAANGTVQSFQRSAIYSGQVLYYGWGGNDYFCNNVGTLQTVAYGGAGNDTLIGDNGADWLYGEAGYDTLYGWGGNDVLDGGTEGDTLYGGYGNDVMYGNAGNDVLYGGHGIDYLFGQGGSDYLNGGNAGEGSYGDGVTDYVYGGTGVDAFHYDYYDGTVDLSPWEGDYWTTS